MEKLRSWVGVTAIMVSVCLAGCRSRQSQGPAGPVDTGGAAGTVIRVEGSDTMVNLAQAWAERYGELHPEVSVQVSGGGSGVGIASLIDGVTDLADASRKMKDSEKARAKENTGKQPQEFVVGLDALAVYVHKDNPIESISMEELAEIYGEGGAITTWSQLGVKNVKCQTDEITRVSRQNSSGTYFYFREAVLGEGRDYKLGSIDQSGSKDVVALVSKTPCAIGYSGMGYLTEGVKWLKISKNKGEAGIAPSVESAKDSSYPIARPLHIYTLGEPTGAIKDYLDWVLSDEGQQIVLDMGYVPVREIGGGQAEPSGTAASSDSATEPAGGNGEPREE